MEIYFMEILSFGAGGRMEECARYLRERCPTESDTERLIVLPIPTTKDKKLVTGTDLPLSEIPNLVKRGTLVAGYGIPDGIGDEICLRGGVLYDALYDEEFLEENAEMTAVGALVKIIGTEKTFPGGLRVGVVGFGRIGKRLVRHLLFLGARVRVYSGNRDTLQSLHSAGVEGCGYGELHGVSELDVLINTAPAGLLRESDVRDAPRLRIVELASGNGLDGIPRVEKMPSLPSVMFPVSAGRAYAERILTRL